MNHGGSPWREGGTWEGGGRGTWGVVGGGGEVGMGRWGGGLLPGVFGGESGSAIPHRQMIHFVTCQRLGDLRRNRNDRLWLGLQTGCVAVVDRAGRPQPAHPSRTTDRGIFLWSTCCRGAIVFRGRRSSYCLQQKNVSYRGLYVRPAG